jgi:hypothetical protein
MRPIGFSTGALAKGDFRRGLDLQRRSGISAIELSALRDHELPHLLEDGVFREFHVRFSHDACSSRVPPLTLTLSPPNAGRGDLS